MFNRAFTLIEILIAVVLLGLAIAAIVFSNIAFTQTTVQTAQLATAEFLIEQIREFTMLKPYADLSVLDGVSYNPPIDSKQMPLTSFSDYTQVINVKNVSDSNLQQVVADSNFLRINVAVLFNNSEIASSSWIRSKPK